MISKTTLVYLIGINLITFLIWGIDKWKAKHGKWRIPESTLLLLAALGGSLGASVGMILFHHKTRKSLFVTVIPVFLSAHTVLLMLFR